MKLSKTDFSLSKKEILADYYIGWQSRNLSLLGRKEVLLGKAKFGIFGDGKEVAQLAMARFFENGDWRSGYYRDQTLMLATGMFTPEEFFYQLFGVTDVQLNPATGGRSFNNHYGSRLLDTEGNWVDQTKQKNSSADVSPTSGQMPRALGLALASKFYRQNKKLNSKGFSKKGNEVVFTTIGDSSTSEGHFFEVLNSAAIHQIPLAIFVWDDGYGISVEKANQTVKSSISEALKGFQKDSGTNGIHIYKQNGWDYPALCKTFNEGISKCRNEQVPVLFHIEQLTQPQGHSTSGSHERYKSSQRLEWEQDFDCLKKLKEWILHEKIATLKELDALEKQSFDEVKKAHQKAWNNYLKPIIAKKKELLQIVENRSCLCHKDKIDKISILKQNLERNKQPSKRDITSSARKLLRNICLDCPSRAELSQKLKVWIANDKVENFERYSSDVYSENKYSVLHQKPIFPVIDENAEEVPGRIILRDNFDYLFTKYPSLVVFGEDVGKIGGVNQTYEGLQEKYGILRLFDTGIRETAIIGKGIGLALRGFRPIAEIQYLDYILYGLPTLSDDLATLHWRTAAGQSAPVIISTRGHRLEGIWHAGSPIGMLINSLRGIYICVPRNMTQAAGMYNTLLEGMDPAIVIEPLNGYRLKEYYPSNIGEYKIALGVPEVLVTGTDITIVTYGSSVRIALDAVRQLDETGISAELIDVQTILPFDINETIVESVKKTNRIIFFDEDVPGGAAAYMMHKVIEEQGGFQYLDTSPRTLSAKEHRPAYSSDGDYYSNPNAEDLFELAYSILNEIFPQKFPLLF